MDNELIEDKNNKQIICQGDYFLYLIYISILNIDKNSPFFNLFSKISFEFIKKLTRLINIKNVLVREQNRKIILHKQIIKYHFFLIDHIIKFKNDDILTNNLFNGIFKNYNLNNETEEQITNLPLIEYEQKYFKEEKFILIKMKIKTMKRYYIKRLFSYFGYWADKKLFFSNEDESEENKLNSSPLKFKIMNFVTNDLKRPILTPILDFEDYLRNYTNENNELNINDFYKNFSWFNKKYENEKTPFQKNIDDIINIIITNKRDILYCFFMKEMYQQSYLIYMPKLIKLGYENDCIFFFKKHKVSNKFKLILYTIGDESQNENIKIKPNYQIFPCLNKSKENLIVINIEDILMFFTRIHNYKHTGLELYLTNGKNYYFDFENINNLKNTINFLTKTQFCDSLSNSIYFIELINYTNQNMEFDLKYKSINGYNKLGYFSNKYIKINNLTDCLQAITINNKTQEF